ncbi:MAG: hypothetical protein RIC16_01955 [Rhodospirillales bacterium]
MHEGCPAAPPCPTGFADIDDHLPAGGLDRAALHEITGVPGVGRASASGFALHLLGLLAAPAAPVLWCLRASDLYGPGIAAVGFEAVETRLILARGRNADEVLWAMEEGLSSGAPAAVLGEPGRLPARLAQAAHRRLQLAAEDHGVTALLIGDDVPQVNGGIMPTPAHTRWRVAPAPGGRWRLELLKCRNGRPARWTVPVPGLPGYLYDRHTAPSAAETDRRPVAAPSGDRPDSDIEAA